MVRPLDLVGKVFGRLTVLSRHPENTKAGSSRWVCSCDCGKTDIVAVGQDLNNGHTQSCGCLQKENTSNANTVHGFSHLPEYAAWKNLIARCHNLQHEHYKYYGARGITVSEEWRYSFEKFYSDMGPRPSEEHSIDRQDNDFGYCKENCRWATQEEQANNKRSNIVFTFDNESLTLAEWAKKLSMNYDTLRTRLKRGWPFEEAICKKKRYSTTTPRNT